MKKVFTIILLALLMASCNYSDEIVMLYHLPFIKTTKDDAANWLFLIDTGASINIINEEFASELGEEIIQTTDLNLIADKNYSRPISSSGVVNNIIVGNVTIETARCISNDRMKEFMTEVMSFSGTPIDVVKKECSTIKFGGILGLPVLKNAMIWFDSEKRRITWNDNTDLPNKFKNLSIATTQENIYLMIPNINYGNILIADALIDTGNPLYIRFYEDESSILNEAGIFNNSKDFILNYFDKSLMESDQYKLIHDVQKKGYIVYGTEYFIKRKAIIDVRNMRFYYRDGNIDSWL